MHKFTIITICFNAEKYIQDTIESVLQQTYTDYEYLIIDGNSKDCTMDIVNSYKNSFIKKRIDYRIYSEDDTGIYNAMNKGIGLAKGQWIQFLNAGDYLCDSKVLDKISLYSQFDGEIIYGDAIIRNKGLFKYKKCGSLDVLDDIKAYKMPFCHQSVFTHNKVLRQYHFDEKYKVCSDHDLFLKLYKAGKNFKYVSLPVAVFTVGGISTTNILRLRKEILEINLDQNLSDKDVIKKMIKQEERWFRLRNGIIQLIFCTVKKISLEGYIEKIKIRKMLHNGWKSTLEEAKENNL